MSIPLQILIPPPTPEKNNSIEKTLNPLLKKSQSLKTSPPPPPPMSHLENCSALTSSNSLHPSPENIATLLNISNNLEKISAPLTQTKPLKENVIRP